jgi:hypothetical protein
MIRRGLPAALLSGTVLLTGCADPEQNATARAATGSSVSEGGAESGSPTPAAAPDDAEATEATEEPAVAADASPEVVEPSADASVTVADVRIGRHDGFDRVVFELGGTGTPGWDVRYVDQATSQGSGNPVDVAGDAVLRVGITGAGYPYETGVEEFSGPNPLAVAGTEVVREAVFDATYEGTTVAFVGTSVQAPFRVYALENPRRVVVEVQDPA